MVKDRDLGSPYGNHASPLMGDPCIDVKPEIMYKSSVCTFVHTHSDVYVPMFENFCFGLLLRSTYINEEQRSQETCLQRHRHPGGRSGLRVQSSELMRQGLARTTWEMQRYHSASFCRQDGPL